MHAYSPSQMSVNIIRAMVPIIYLVLIGAWVADAQNLGKGDVSRWLSSTMDVLRERREVMEKGGPTELDPRLVAAEKKPRVITVRQDGTGDFRRLTEAVDSVPPGNLRRTIIRIGKGVYREKLVVPREKRYITFYGESADEADMPVISYNGIAAEYNGTIFSATVAVESNHFMAVNMIFENNAPMQVQGQENSQAVAFRIYGDKAAFFNCRFRAFQDTLCDQVGHHFFYNCSIQGTIDFIFGNGRSIYMNSELYSVATGRTALTAQGRESIADKSGFSFVQCKVNGTGPPGTAMLSRAWKPRSMVVFAFSYLSSVVDRYGWDNKGYNERERTVRFGEYNCTGPGSVTDGRVGYGRILNQKQAQNYYSPTFIHAKTWLLAPPCLL